MAPSAHLEVLLCGQDHLQFLVDLLTDTNFDIDHLSTCMYLS